MLADGNDFYDERLIDYIAAARQQVEHDASLICYTGEFTWATSEFPARDWLEIPNVRPVSAIGSITYIDTAGSVQTWSSSEYALKQFHKVAVIALAYNEQWPVVRGDANGITVSLTAGYATVLAVPRMVKQAVLLALQTMWSDAMGTTDRQGIQSVDATRLAYERQIELIRREVYA